MNHQPKKVKRKRKVKEAKKIIISLSQPDKMPGFAYGLAAWDCKTDGKLSAVAGSV